MKKILIIIIILISSSIFADVYLKSVFKPKTTIVFKPKTTILNLCPKDNDYWNTIALKCVCNDGYKESPIGCIDDDCKDYSCGDNGCGDNGYCESKLKRDKGIYPNPPTYHYEASCNCSENYVEFDSECIENPCLEYDCYEYGYCEAVEDKCECKEGYVEYGGHTLYKNNQEIPADSYLTCIPTYKTWDWISGDKECDLDDGVVRYAVYSENNSFENDKKCKTRIDSCRCIESPFMETNKPGTSFLMSDEDLNNPYTKENGWILLNKDLGFPLYISEEKLEVVNFVPVPRFLLYNKYTGSLKVFTFLRKVLETYSHGVLRTSFRNGSKTMLFNNSFSNVFSEGHYNNFNIDSINTVGDFFTTTIVPDLPGTDDDKYWFYGNIDTAYDTNTKNIVGSSIEFKLEGVKVVNGDGNILGYLTERVDSGNSSSSTIDGLMDTFNMGMIDNAKKYYKDVGSFANEYISEESLMSNVGEIWELKDFIATSKMAANIAGIVNNIVPYIGAAFAFIDFFTGSTAFKKPTIFDAKLSIRWETIESGNIYTTKLKTPGTIDKRYGLTSLYLPIYDKPLGVFSLISPIVLDQILYDSTYIDCQDELEGEDCMADPNRKYYYRLSKLPEIKINPDSGLKMDSAYVSIVGELDLLNDSEAINWDINGTGRNNVQKISEKDKKDESTNEITNKIAKYSTVSLPYDIAKNNLSITLPLNAKVFIKLTVILKTKRTENIKEKKFIFTNNYIADKNNTGMLLSEYPSISLFQSKLEPIGNVIIDNSSEDNLFKRGELIELSYHKPKNKLTNSLYTLFPYQSITISDIKLEEFTGDNSAWSWLENSDKISSYDLYDDIKDEICDEASTSFNCNLKLALENNKGNNYSTYYVKRKFIVPTNISLGTHTLKIPIRYYTYTPNDLYSTGYKSEEHTYTYTKEIEVVE